MTGRQPCWAGPLLSMWALPVGKTSLRVCRLSLVLFLFLILNKPFSFGGLAGELLGQATRTSENPASRLQSSVRNGG